MLRSFEQTRNVNLALRIAVILSFTLLTALSARVTVEINGVVPFTLQVLVVLLAGMVLGARDGAASQIAYVALIASGMPIDARALGPAALTGPTAGFLFGFIPAAFIAGWLVEEGFDKVWLRWIAGVAGIVVIYVFGTTWLKTELGLTWETAWTVGVKPFIGVDLAKALVAAMAAEGGRQLLAQQLNYLPEWMNKQ
jgi:biotin transport system substrate-specific component